MAMNNREQLNKSAQSLINKYKARISLLEHFLSGGTVKVQWRPQGDYVTQDVVEAGHKKFRMEDEARFGRPGLSALRYYRY